jgi:MraZ protein
MFLGEYQHSLDAKGRVILPAKFREQLEGGAFITKLLDGCLAVWTPEEFDKVATDMLEKARRGQAERNVFRSFMAGSADVAPDKQGRIAIPANLREFADLDRDVVVTGAYSRIEIWNAEKWRAVNAQGEQHLVGAGESLADVGI